MNEDAYPNFDSTLPNQPHEIKTSVKRISEAIVDHDKSFIIVIERMIEQKLLKIKNADLAKSTSGVKEDLAAYETLLQVREAFKVYG